MELLRRSLSLSSDKAVTELLYAPLTTETPVAAVGEERVGESHQLAWSSESGGEMLTLPE